MFREPYMYNLKVLNNIKLKITLNKQYNKKPTSYNTYQRYNAYLDRKEAYVGRIGCLLHMRHKEHTPNIKITKKI